MIEDRRKLRTELFYASGYIRNWQHEPSPSRDLATIASRLRKGQPDNAGGALILKSSEKKDFEEAAKHGELALALKHRLYTNKKSPDQQLLANSLWKMTRVYRQLGQLSKSEACAREWLQIELNLHPGKDHGYVTDAETELAVTLLAEGKKDEALQYAQECYEISKQVFEPDNSRRIQIKEWLIEVYKSLGDEAKVKEISESH